VESNGAPITLAPSVPRCLAATGGVGRRHPVDLRSGRSSRISLCIVVRPHHAMQNRWCSSAFHAASPAAFEAIRQTSVRIGSRGELRPQELGIISDSLYVAGGLTDLSQRQLAFVGIGHVYQKSGWLIGLARHPGVWSRDRAFLFVESDVMISPHRQVNY
jgi:hypothetical protein